MVSRGRRAGLIVLLVCVGALIAGPARAQRATSEAEREFKLGYRALQAGDCVEALVHYRRSLELARRPRTLFNIATCEEDLGQDAAAWRDYHAFLELAEDRDASIVEKARARIDGLRARLRGRVSVESSPPGASVHVDGERDARGVTPLTLSLPPGAHVVRVSMPDTIAVERTVTVEPEQATSLRVELALPSTITILVEPEDAVIEPHDGGSAVQGRLELAVPPGRHAFTIRREGRRSEEVVVEAIAGRTHELRVHLRPDPEAAHLDLATETDDRSAVAIDLRPRVSARRRWLGWGVGGLGIASLAAGGAVGVLALRDVASSDPAEHDRGKARALLADGLFVGGAVAVVVAWRLLKGGSR